MEPFTYYLCLFLALLFPALLLKLKRHDNNDLRLPPGPWQLPVIGSVHHLLSSRLPHHVMADIAHRLKAPLIYLKLGEVPVVIASSPDAACEIMKTQDVNFATRPLSLTTTMKVFFAEGEGLGFAPYSTLWRQLRKITVMQLLSVHRVQSFHGIREEEVGRLVAAIAASPMGEAVNLSQRITEVINDMVVRSMIGDRFERKDEFLRNAAEAVKIFTTGFSLGDLFPSSRLASLIGGTARRAAETHRKMFELMDYTIKKHEERRAAMATSIDGEDVLDVLLRIHKEGDLEVPLTMRMIKTIIVELFGAGSATAASILQWAMSELVRNPKVMERAQAEVREKLQGKTIVTDDDLVHLKYIKLIIKETLRLHPPVPLLVPRECRESCKVMGYDVPKGTTVLVNVWAISRDPKYWDHPTTFIPERFEAGTIDFKGTDFKYTPFGAGRRICAGMAFAQANMELVLTALLHHFDWKLPGGMLPSELDMTEGMGVAAGRKHDLYLHPVVSVPPHV